MRLAVAALGCALLIGCATETPEHREERIRLSVAARTAKMERWCARRGQIFVGETYGKVYGMHTREIACRAPRDDAEREMIATRAQ